MTKASWMIGSILLGTTLLTGCSTAPAGAPNNATTVDNRVSSSGQTGNQAGGQGANQAGGQGANTVAPDTTGAGTANVSSPPLDQKGSAQALVAEAMKLAKQGTSLNLPFSDQQNISAVQSVWGKATSLSGAGAGIYCSYANHAAAVGINQGEQIFDLRSYSANLHTVTLADVEAVLGSPGAVRHTPDSDIYMYPAGPDYQLLWMFSRSTTGAVSSTVNHTSVFWPAGTVNQMAATQPAPSIAIDNPPGSVGSLVTFSIVNAPSGYRLVELEWIANHGPAVVNTFSQAVNAGRAGGANPAFSISPDGQTLSFLYPASMRAQTGRLRVIYQSTSGEAMIGSSATVTLK